jgi:hypothetical protein
MDIVFLEELVVFTVVGITIGFEEFKPSLQFFFWNQEFAFVHDGFFAGGEDEIIFGAHDNGFFGTHFFT